ncbi:ABC transporter transmembrane domain-containing protein [Streptomyces indicus]|uniref:Putative ABC transport system ATP-binding protein n=1 Tax=Streptomyces indicus TaxID=417292 RepID=A0A1G8TPP9_9ACTN|nr:ABC transporter ATP-binding protein [Streptomyces indicus]SDJ43502.1 putative ABC transport system ATP-binding protein [Streptomyces indicus]
MRDAARHDGREVLRTVIKDERRRVAAACVLNSSHQIGEALIPVLIGFMVDRAIVRPDLAAFGRWALILAVVYVFLSGGFQLGARAAEYAKEHAGHTLRLRLIRRVLDPYGGAERGRPPGALVSVTTEDARRAGAVTMALPLGFGAVVGLATGAVLLLRASVPLGLLILLGTPVLMGLGQLLARPLEQRSHAEQERAAHASGVAADLVAGVRVLQGLGAQRAASDRYRRTSRAALDATVRAARAEGVQTGMMQTLTGVFIALVALVGGHLVLSGAIGLGELVAAVGLALFLPGPLHTVAWMAADVARSRASAGRVGEVLAAPGDIAVAGDAGTPVGAGSAGTSAVTGGAGTSAGAGSAETPAGAGSAGASAGAGSAGTPAADDRVPAARTEATPPALRLTGLTHEGLTDLELAVAPGEFLGVVVTDPAHADTLVRCLARRTDPDAGTLALDGVPFTALPPRELRARLLVAAHAADLFTGSIEENITAAGGTAHEAASRAAAADEVAASVPGGMAAPVGERGRALSGGQRQRIALARALAADREVLVVHDPTTAIDAATEARIATGLREVRRGRTTVLVTSSPALLAAADRVVLIDGGRLTDEARHEELVQRNARYRTAVLA